MPYTQDCALSICSVARTLLVEAGLLASQPDPAGGTGPACCWSVPAEAVEDARAVVAAAAAAGALVLQGGAPVGAGPMLAAAEEQHADGPAGVTGISGGSTAPTEQQQQLSPSWRSTGSAGVAGRGQCGGAGCPSDGSQPATDAPAAAAPVQPPVAVSQPNMPPDVHQAWPLPLSDEVLRLLTPTWSASELYLQRIRRWAAACLHCLLQVSGRVVKFTCL